MSLTTSPEPPAKKASIDLLTKQVRDALQCLLTGSREHDLRVTHGHALRVVCRLLYQRYGEVRGLLPSGDSPGETAPFSDQSMGQAIAVLSGLDLSAVEVWDLGGVYESLLELQPRRVDGRIVLLTDRRGRKATGSFYTPRHIVDTIVEQTIGPLVKQAAAEVARLDQHEPDALWVPYLSIKVLDPAMGCGQFLLGAVDFLARAMADNPLLPTTEQQARRLVAERCLYGVDLDPLAVELARLSLRLHAGWDPGLDHLRCGDALLGAWPDDRWFHAVVGNPPYLNFTARSNPIARLRADGRGTDADQLQQRVAACRERYPEASTGVCDDYKWFMALALRLVRPGGRFGFITPDTWLWYQGYADLRALVRRRCSKVEASDLGAGIFADPTVPCAITTARLATTDEACETAIAIDDRRRVTVPVVSPGLDSLTAAWPKLGALSDQLRIVDGGLNYNRRAVSQRVVYESSTADHRDDLRTYRGGSFHRYTPIVGSRWLRHNWRDSLQPGETLRYSETLAATTPKLAIRQTADRIIATEDRLGLVPERSVLHAVVEGGEVALRSWLGILNSELFTSLYRQRMPEVGRAMAQVKVGVVRELPAPPCEDGPAAEQLAGLVGRMLSLTADRDAEIARFLAWLEARLEASIDALPGKTMLRAYHEHDYEAVREVLKRNRRRLAHEPAKDRTVRLEFEQSTATLAPLKAEIEATDQCIERLVRRLYRVDDHPTAPQPPASGS